MKNGYSVLAVFILIPNVSCLGYCTVDNHSVCIAYLLWFPMQNPIAGHCSRPFALLPDYVTVCRKNCVRLPWLCCGDFTVESL